MKVTYYTESPYRPELKYILYIISLCYEVVFEESENRKLADISIGGQETDTLFFISDIFDRLYSSQPYYALSSMLMERDGKKDYLSTIFYLVNTLQELNPDPLCRDKLERYSATASLQVAHNVLQKNVVSGLAAQVIKIIDPSGAIQDKKSQTRIFLSHDMDTVHGSLMQDTYWQLKKFNVPAMIQIMFSNIMKGPEWVNVDKIMAIESESDFKATFFWMARKGEAEAGLRNADYATSDRQIVRSMQEISKRGWNNGIHKCIGPQSFFDELQSLPSGIRSNRYHYLYFDTFKDLPKVEASPIQLDCSLGFASEMGFRNSFGLPVHLFDVRNRRPYRFLECPLHCMDGTYSRYHFKSGDEFAKDVITFVEKNSTNCVLSVLFHNNYISEHKFADYLKAFKQLLAFFYESGFKSISEDEILELYA